MEYKTDVKHWSLWNVLEGEWRARNPHTGRVCKVTIIAAGADRAYCRFHMDGVTRWIRWEDIEEG